ncbi:hypothetical protein H6G76_11155 [Nostoc sp. FACHB-152]|uniref:hypothetical protein n=1 Tax=unclassified Nostoc TaxID=2593658 RepID=UPI001682E746|nr:MULTISPECIES: hypothetical protein [unclassified Nostoc]MBD2447722.1 hypothetical protein [Nostoc sp. FACHB-152]
MPTYPIELIVLVIHSSIESSPKITSQVIVANLALIFAQLYLIGFAIAKSNIWFLLDHIVLYEKHQPNVRGAISYAPTCHICT